MPRLDSTGPFGTGPRTGRGLGKCGTHIVEGLRPAGSAFRGVGRGFAPWGGGRGRCFGGRGRGWYRGPFGGGAPMSLADETEALKVQLAAAERGVTAMRVRLEELEKR